MNRLSLAELKAKSSNEIILNLEAINGGNADSCHNCSCMQKAINQNPDNEGNELINLICVVVDFVKWLSK